MGIVRNVRHDGLEVALKEKFYRPHAQFMFPVRNRHLVVKTAGDPLARAAPIRGEVRALDASLPVAGVRSMQDMVAASMSQPRLAQWVLGLFGGLALLLASIGLYGVLSYVVSERQHEIGIRLAIGAEPRGVRAMVLRQGLGLSFAGVAGGMARHSRWPASWRHCCTGSRRTNPVTFVAVPSVLIAVSAMASFVAAWRATRVSPLLALKAD